MLEELNNIHASEELMQETLNYCKAHSNDVSEGTSDIRKIPHKFSRFAATAAACASIVILSSGAAFAYNTATGGKLSRKIYNIINTAQSLNYADGITDDNGNTYTYDGLTDVNLVKSDKNLTVTMDSYVVDGNKADIMFTVNTNDGSPLNEITEDKVAVISRDHFADVKITINGKELNPSERQGYFIQQRVDDASDPSKATIKITLEAMSMPTLDGSKLTFNFSNYTSYYSIMNSVGFRYESVADMLKNVTLADESSFTGENTYGYSDSPVVLAPGRMHIEFSDRYPGSYIDNAGYTVKESTNGTKTFVMTIVPANDTAAEALSRINVQSTASGLPVALYTKKLDDGRIQLAYSANGDRNFSKSLKGTYIDTDDSHLATLVMKNLVAGDTEQVISSKQCDVSFDCELSGPEAPIYFDTDLIVNDTVYKGTVINVKTVTISKTKIAMTGTIKLPDENARFSGAGTNSPLITMKNGTSFNAGNKNGAGYDTNTGEWDSDWILSTYINPGDVESITWHGTTIYKAR